MQNILEAYSEGVNDGVETLVSLPMEYKVLGATWERWQPVDTHSIMKLVFLDLSHDFFNEAIRELISKMDSSVSWVAEELVAFKNEHHNKYGYTILDDSDLERNGFYYKDGLFKREEEFKKS